MSLEAVAVVKVPPAEVDRALAAAPSETEGLGARRGADGEAYPVRPLEDATAVHLGVQMTAAPEQIAERIRSALGELLDRHAHPRGVPVYPASYAPEATTFDALVDELGEAADWISLDAPAPADPFAALASALGGAGIDIEALSHQLHGQDPSELMQQAMGLAQQLAESGQLGEVQRAMMDMMGGLPIDPEALMVESGVDVEAMRELLDDPESLDRLGLSPEQLEALFERTGGDPRAALEELGLSPEAVAQLAGKTDGSDDQS